MPDFEEKHEYNVAGSIWLDQEKILMELSGTRIKEKELASTSINNVKRLNFQRQVPVPFQLNSMPASENLLFQDRKDSGLKAQSLEDELTMLLLEIPGVKDANPQKRYELIRIVDDPRLRRETRKKNIGEIESPENYIRSLIDYLIDLDQLEQFLVALANLNEPSQFNKKLSKWKAKYASKRSANRDIQTVSHDNPRRNFHREMCRSFDLEDINTLCFDLNIAPDEIPGARLSVKIRNLILYLERTGRIQELIILLKEKRPKGHWEYPPE